MKNVDNPAVNFQTNGNSITIRNFNNYYIENDLISFSIANIINPMAAIDATSSFQISVCDSNNNIYEQQQDNLGYRVIADPLINLTITPQNPVVENSTDLTISFIKNIMLNSVGIVLYKIIVYLRIFSNCKY